ncbi:MAG: glycosyltransferase family 4 protein [Campylobacterota bacterium]|nr:glycosyltransferase family 4 protein [Campylobacterota bacterium]
MKPKLLCVLHRSPPAHGAAKVGDFIASSEKLKNKYDCKFITIKSSDSIEDIGKISFRKIYLVIELYLQVLWALISFRPNKIYFTSSMRSIALYRDILISTLWKFYALFKSVDIYYHYHTKGINEYISSSKKNFILTSFFIKNVNLILLSPLLRNDFQKLDSYKSIVFLPNGVEDSLKDKDVNDYIENKYENLKHINIFYLAHMMKDKGYDKVLNLAKLNKNGNFHFHFAGSWKSEEDKEFFFSFIKKYDLKNITFHGFVFGKEKDKLFEQAHIFIYPTKNDAFPLTLLEALSYAIPIITTNQGSIPYMIDEKSGIVLNDIDKLSNALIEAKDMLLNMKTSKYCRQRYEENFSLEQFENNLVNIFTNRSKSNIKGERNDKK